MLLADGIHKNTPSFDLFRCPYLETFPTVYCPITYSDAKHFIRVFERHFQKLHDNQSFDRIRERMDT